jgi:hypothetical protein
MYRAVTLGEMAGHMLENLRITICMVMDIMYGGTVENIKEVINMIKKMDLVSIDGVMGGFTLDSGKMENRMDMENILQIIKHSVVSGKTERENIGLMMRN